MWRLRRSSGILSTSWSLTPRTPSAAPPAFCPPYRGATACPCPQVTTTGDPRPRTGTGDPRPRTGTGDPRPRTRTGDPRPRKGFTGDPRPRTGAGDPRPRRKSLARAFRGPGGLAQAKVSQPGLSIDGTLPSPPRAENVLRNRFGCSCWERIKPQ